MGEEEEDIYDFSGLSLSDLCIESAPSPSGDVENGFATAAMKLRSSSSSSALFEGRYDEEEWYPPTPPPYDVGDKLTEANRRLLEDPTSEVHVPERLRWRRASSLVEIRWMRQSPVDFCYDDSQEHPGASASASASSPSCSSAEEIVVIDDLSGLRLDGGRVVVAVNGGSSFVGEEDLPNEDWSTSESISAASVKTALSPGAGGKPVGTSREKNEEEEEEVEEDLVEEQEEGEGRGRRGCSVPNGHNSGGEVEEKEEEEEEEEEEEKTTTTAVARRRVVVDRTRVEDDEPLTLVNGVRNGGTSSSEGEEGVAGVGVAALSGRRGQAGRKGGRSSPLPPKQQDLNVSNGGSVKSELRRQQQQQQQHDNSNGLSKSSNKSRDSRVSSATSFRGLTSSQSLTELNGYAYHNGSSSSSSNRHHNFRRRNSSSPSPSSSLSPVPTTTTTKTTTARKSSAPPLPKPSLLPTPVPTERKSISFRGGVSNGGCVAPLSGGGGGRRCCSSAPLLQRKISRNSLSSNSSLSSHSTTGDDGSNSSDSIVPPGAAGLRSRASREAADQAFAQWRQRKKEEKRLRERRMALLQAQLRAKL